MHQVGGKEWTEWYQRWRDTILPMQSPDGSWARATARRCRPDLSTSIAVITLSVPAGYLPIFQR